MHTANLLADGTVLVTGGIGDGEVGLDTAEIYDPATQTFHPTESMAAKRAAPAVAMLGDGRVLVTQRMR